LSQTVFSRKWNYALGSVTIIGIAFFALVLLKHRSVVPVESRGVPATSPRTAGQVNRRQVAASFATLPLAFEPNMGQVNSKVRFLARSDGYTLFLTQNDAVFSLHSQHLESAALKLRRGQEPHARNLRNEKSSGDLSAIVRMRFAGANQIPRIACGNVLPGKSNYFLGNDHREWHSNVPHYASVSYQELYPGVSMSFHGEQRQPEFDLLVASGADPSVINLEFKGQQRIATSDVGDLVIASSAGNILLHKPVAYQELNGKRRLVDARFVLEANHRVRFALGNYDRSHDLVIDPSVSYAYSSYLGGANEDDGFGVAFDSSGNMYVTGETASTNFPEASNANSGGFDAFVTKISANGASLIYSTYVGGNSADSGNAIAVNPTTGVAFVAGGSASTNFPTTTGAYQTALNGSTGNAILFQLDSSGSLTYSTYLGGTGTDTALGLALDSSGNLYSVGTTSSSNFPTKNPLQSSFAGGFVAKLNPAGGGASDLIFSTYVGAGTGDYASAVALDSSTNVYVTGRTTSPLFHTTSGAVQSAYGGGSADAFVSVISSTGGSYVYSTFLGGGQTDVADGIAVDASGDAYVTGETASTDFPVQSPFQAHNGGGYDAFIAKLNPSGSTLLYSTYLGGNLDDIGVSIAVDANNDAYITGQTLSTSGFPTVNPTQAALAGSSDAFVSEINAAGSQLLFSTYLGGSGDEDTTGNFGSIAVDSSGYFIYVTGNTTSSSGFPTQAPLPYSGGSTYGGGAADAFVTKYAQGPVFNLVATTPAAVSAGSSASSTVTLTSYNGYSASVTLSCSVTGTGSPLPACSASSFQPDNVVPTATPGATSALSITTTGSSGAVLYPGRFFYTLWLPILGLCFFGARGSSSRSLRNKFSCLLTLTIITGTLFLMPACGGSNSSSGATGGSGGGSSGTPAGTYTVTITGTDSNNLTQSTQIALTVN